MQKRLLVLSILLLNILLLQAQSPIPQKKGKLWGFVNEAGVFVIEPKYTAVGDFLSDYTWVNMDGKGKYPHHVVGGKWGVIDKTGKVVCPIKYDYVDLCKNDLVAVNMGGIMNDRQIEGGTWGFVNLIDGSEITELKYAQVGAFASDGVAWALKEGDLIKKVGKAVETNPRGKTIAISRTFDVLENYTIENLFENPKTKGKWVLIDMKGSELSSDIYEMVGDFCFEVAVINIGSKHGFINNKGKEIIEPKYDSITSCNKEGVLWLGQGRKGNQLFGLVRKDGRILTEIKYKSAVVFENGVSWVSEARSYYLIDSTGKELTTKRYAKVSDFSHNISRVQQGSLYGFVNNKGIEIIPIKYSEAQELFGVNSSVKFKRNKNNLAVGWVKEMETNKIIWIDEKGVVVAESANKEFNIIDTVPSELWDY